MFSGGASPRPSPDSGAGGAALRRGTRGRLVGATGLLQRAFAVHHVVQADLEKTTG